MESVAPNFTSNMNPPQGTYQSNSAAYQPRPVTYFDPLSYSQVQRNKVAAIIHMAFKIPAIVLYIFSGLLFKSFIFPFVVILVLVSFDFWVVKNITGRYLLGLRWWNRTVDSDNEVWVFEFKDTNLVSAADSNMFWISTYSVLLVWSIFAVISFIRFNFGWTIICSVAIGMSLINLTAYSKCDKYAKTQLRKGTRDDLAGVGFFSNIFGPGAIRFLPWSWFT